jgi:hypothetical protein
VGPTPGAPTLSLASAVRIALEQAFVLLDSRDAVNASRWREKAALAEFYPSLTPIYQRGEGAASTASISRSGFPGPVAA